MESIDIKHLAELSRLAVPEDKVADVEQKIKNILNFIDKIKTVEIGEQGANKPEFFNIAREDIVDPVVSESNLVEVAPENEVGFVKVPKVLG